MLENHKLCNKDRVSKLEFGLAARDLREDREGKGEGPRSPHSFNRTDIGVLTISEFTVRSILYLNSQKMISNSELGSSRIRGALMVP